MASTAFSSPPLLFTHHIGLIPIISYSAPANPDQTGHVSQTSDPIDLYGLGPDPTARPLPRGPFRITCADLSPSLSANSPQTAGKLTLTGQPPTQLPAATLDEVVKCAGKILSVETLNAADSHPSSGDVTIDGSTESKTFNPTSIGQDWFITPTRPRDSTAVSYELVCRNRRTADGRNYRLALLDAPFVLNQAPVGAVLAIATPVSSPSTSEFCIVDASPLLKHTKSQGLGPPPSGTFMIYHPQRELFIGGGGLGVPLQVMAKDQLMSSVYPSVAANMKSPTDLSAYFWSFRWIDNPIDDGVYRLLPYSLPSTTPIGMQANIDPQSRKYDFFSNSKYNPGTDELALGNLVPVSSDWMQCFALSKTASEGDIAYFNPQATVFSTNWWDKPSAVPLVSDVLSRWRIITVLSATAELRWLIYEDAAQQFLAHRNLGGDKMASYLQSSAKGDGPGLDAIVALLSQADVLSGALNEELEKEFESRYGDLIWTISPAYRGPMAISENNIASETLLVDFNKTAGSVQTVAHSNPASAEEWWIITSNVTSEGQVYYEMRNYKTSMYIGQKVLGGSIWPPYGKTCIFSSEPSSGSPAATAVNETRWFIDVNLGTNVTYHLYSFDQGSTLMRSGFGASSLQLQPKLNLSQSFTDSQGGRQPSWLQGVFSLSPIVEDLNDPINTWMSTFGDQDLQVMHVSTNTVLRSNTNPSDSNTRLATTQAAKLSSKNDLVTAEKWKFARYRRLRWNSADEARFYENAFSVQLRFDPPLVLSGFQKPVWILSHGDTSTQALTLQPKEDDGNLILTLGVKDLWHPSTSGQSYQNGMVSLSPLGISPPCYLSVDYVINSGSLVLKNDSSGTCWRTLSQSSLSALSPNPQLPSLQSFPELEDGVYRIVNRITNNFLFLNDGSIYNSAVIENDANLIPFSPGSLVMKPSTESTLVLATELWYVSRCGSYYRIEAYGSPQALDLMETWSTPPPEGRPLTMTPRQPLYQSQAWNIFPVRSGVFVIQNSYDSSALEDAGVAEPKSAFLNAAIKSQTWIFKPALPLIPTGMYKISFPPTGVVPESTYLGCWTGADMSNSTPMTLQWLVTHLPDGLYSLQAIGLPKARWLASRADFPDARSYLCVSEFGLSSSSKWKLFPFADGTFSLQNLVTSRILVPPSSEKPSSFLYTDYTSDLSAESQQFWCCANAWTSIGFMNVVFETLDSTDCYLDIPTDQPIIGRYYISSPSGLRLSVKRTVTPGAGAKPMVSLIDNSIPSDKATASLVLNNSPVWELVSSKNGYYYIVNRKTGGKLASPSEIFESATAESQTPRMLDEFLDCTRWKLFWLDLTMKRFRIVNKATGSMLCNSSNTVTAMSWSSRWGDFTWLLDPVPSTEWIPPWNPSPEFSFLWRDLDVASGEYTIESRGVMSGKCLALNPNISPYQIQLSDVDLHPLSTTSGQQHWIIQKDDEGWYRIRGYLWDLQLTSSANPLQDPTLRLLKPRSDDPTKASPNLSAEISIDPSQMQWKFVGASDKVRIIGRASLRSGTSYVTLAAGRVGDKLSGVLGAGFAEETWWNIRRVQGPSTRLKLISGIYSLSVGKQNRSALSQSLSSIVLNGGFVAGPPSSDFQYLVKPSGLSTKIASTATPSSSIGQMMWYFSNGWQPGTFTISAVSDIKSWWLANAGGVIASLPPPGPNDTSYLWTAEPRECYTYVLRSVHDPGLVLGAKQDGTGYSLSLGTDLETNIWTCKWDFTREGFYIQNNAPSAMCTAMTAVSTTKAVNLTYISLLSSSPNQIWHVSEVFNATPPFVRLFNESLFMSSGATSALPRAVVQMEGMAALQPQTDWATVTTQPNQTWKISQFYSPTPLPFTASKLDVVISGNSNADAQSQLWTFLPVNKVDIGPLTSYPGCVLNIGNADNPQNLDWMKLQALRMADRLTVTSDPYILGDPLTRFRLVTYGSLFMMVSDSWNMSVATNSTTVSALGEGSIAAEPICWYTLRPKKSGGKEIVPLVTVIDPTKNPPNSMLVPWQVITNYVDFVDTGTLCRIRAGTSGFLSAGPTQVIGGQVNVKPLDLLDKGQLWRYAEWGTAIKCRSIYHVQTGLTLRANMAFQPIASAPTVTSPDSLNALVLNPITTLKFNNEFLAPGYMWLKPRVAEKDNWDALSVPGLDPTTTPSVYDPRRHGFQFIPVSPQSTTFTTKMSILQNFVRNNAPVLLHMPGTVFPANVSVHLTDADIVKDGIGSESAAAFLSRTPRSSDDSRWFIKSPIAFTFPWRDGDLWMPTSSAPTAYVTVRPSTDVAWLHYTDVTYWLLYSTPFRTFDNGEPGFGWASVSLRVNNDNGRIVSVLLNGRTRYANLDSQFSGHIDPADNPLKFLSCPSPSPSPSATPFTQTGAVSSSSTSTSRRLHLIVQALTPTNITNRRFIFTPSSRVHSPKIDAPPTTEANPDLDAKMSDWKAWEDMGGKVLDLGLCHRIVEAEMITTKVGKVGTSVAVNAYVRQQAEQQQKFRDAILRTGARLALPPVEADIAADPGTESGEMVNGVLIPDENWMRTKITWLPVTTSQRDVRSVHGPGCEWETDPLQLARV